MSDPYAQVPQHQPQGQFPPQPYPQQYAQPPQQGRFAKLQHTGVVDMMRYMRMLNFGNAMLIVASGILSLISLTTFTLTSAFVALYTTMFGCMLMCFECRMTRFEESVRANVGFLYSFIGRAAFLVFISSICFGVAGTYAAAGTVVGVLTLLNSLFNCYVMFAHPGFKASGLTIFSDPTQGYVSGESVMQTGAGHAATYGGQVIQNNPELMQQAASGAANYAVNNPQVAAQVLQAGVQQQYAQPQPNNANPFAGGGGAV